MKKILLTSFLFFASSYLFSQHLAMPIEDAKNNGIIIHKLDSLYQSAIHVDTTKAVFNTQESQIKMKTAYVQMLNDFGQFLKENNYIWPKATHCFNRIYFAEDGSINYFLYQFKGKDEDLPSAEQQLAFQKLLSQFVLYYKIGISANKKFAQCSPVTYKP